MKILIANTIIFIFSVLLAVFAYLGIVKADVEMSAVVGLTPENCVTTCIAECENMTIEFGEDYYKEIIEF